MTHSNPSCMYKILPFLTMMACLAGSLYGAAVPEVLKVGKRPESITRGFDGDYFVTVMNGKEKGDAVVKRIHGTEVSVFARGLDEPKGIVFVGDHLITTDLKRVVTIDSQGQVTALASESDFPKPISYLNDAAVSPDGKSVYIVDMGANTKMIGPDGKLWPWGSTEAASLPMIGRVYRIDLNGSVELVIDANKLMPCPNGVGIGKDGQLLIGAFFTGNLLEKTEQGLRVVHDSLRGADAVEQDDEGYYYVSSWSQGRVWRVSPDGKQSWVIGDGFRSAADFYLEAEQRRLLLPDMLSGTIHVVTW